VRIADLAKNLLKLSGADRVDGQPGLVYTGLRPGEKLHEELVAPDEGSRATRIPKVRLVVPMQSVLPRISEKLAAGEKQLGSIQASDIGSMLSGMFPDLFVPPSRGSNRTSLHAAGRHSG